MRRAWRGILVGLVMILAPVAGLADEGEANRLFVEAVKLWKRAQTLPVADRWDFYVKIRDSLDAVVEEHPDSSLAVKLVIGEKVGPIDREYIEHVIEAYAPERRAQAVALEAAVRTAFADGSTRLELRCRQRAHASWSAHVLTGRILPEDDRFEGRLDDVDYQGRYLPPGTLRIDGFGTLEFDATGRARMLGERECVLELPADLRLALRLEADCRNRDARCRIRAIFDIAAATARSIENANWRSAALGAIGQAQARAGLRAEASWLLAEALETARRIEAPFELSSTLAEIAQAQARAGLRTEASRLFTEALETVHSIEGAFQRSAALGAIAQAQARAGLRAEAPRLFAEALEVARSIEDAGWRSWALRAIAEAQADAGLFAQALETVRGIENGDVRRLWTVGIFVAQAEAELAAQEQEAASPPLTGAGR